MIDTIKRHEVDRVMNNQNELMQSTREMRYVDLYICMYIQFTLIVSNSVDSNFRLSRSPELRCV
jgi:hypothetical protein